MNAAADGRETPHQIRRDIHLPSELLTKRSTINQSINQSIVDLCSA